jgi:murein DD-endopeptidase MepM/ murein hydrolase activator NlpD
MTSRRTLGLAITLLAGCLLPAQSAAAGPHRWPAARLAPRPPRPTVAYGWPMDGTHQVTRAFQPPPQPWLPGHRGVDLGATPGTVVRAAGAGVVAFAGRVAGTGVVSIDHPGGLRTTYEPVAPLVRAGQPVRLGQPIGVLLAGHPDCPVPACLHWGLRRGSVYLDPLALLGIGRVRLLPLVAAAGATRCRVGMAGQVSDRGNAGRPATGRSYSSGRP